MADRYPNRPLPANDYGRGGDQYGSGGNENDPLAELARLIGQADPFAGTGRTNPPASPRAAPARAQHQPQYQQPQYQEPVEDDELPPAGPPTWIQRANIQRQQAVQETPPPLPYEEPEEYPSQNYQAQEYPGTVHPLHRYAAQAGAHQGDDQEASYDQASYDQAEEHTDPSRYDDALYGQIESGAQDFQRDPAYPDDPYAYQDGYDEDQEEQRPKRRGGLFMVAAVLALAVIGTGAAFAYRTFVGSPRSGEPPIIKADNSPTKIVAAPSDGSGKTLDRMPSGDGAEKLVPREEAPVDVNTRAAGPRVVFPPLNANNSPPSPASVSPSTMPPNVAPGAPSNGTMPNSEPRKIRTLSVHGDQGDNAAAPVTAAPPPPAGAKQAAATRQIPPPAAPRGAPAPAGSAPLSLSPDSAQASLPPVEPRTRTAATTPAQTAPSSDAAPAVDGRFLVQVSSQKTEADAQASFRALQKKFPDALGSQSPLIRRADLGGDKGTVYRAMVGPFGSREEAVRFCVNYKSAGGQCYIP
jgi:hypothetical protein